MAMIRLLVSCQPSRFTVLVFVTAIALLVVFETSRYLHTKTNHSLSYIGRVDAPRRAMSTQRDSSQKPNILFLLVDDLGYNDVGYHAKKGGSAIRTPAIDELAEQGVKLENYYVQPLCSPTRSQLMTGRYQIHMGIQHYLFEHARPHCLPLDEVTLPTKLKEAGYSTHAIGKWHLGFCHKACLPTSRGFDTFFGLYTGGGDHWYYNRSMEGHREFSGHDLHDDTAKELRNVRQYDGIYSAELFTSRAQEIIKTRQEDQPFFLYLAYKNVHFPLQAPERYKNLYRDSINNAAYRQTYAGMVSAVDESVRNLTKTLWEEGVWDNTIIIFSSDNGGSLNTFGNNWPLRGGKAFLNEGGVRAVGFVSSPLLPKAVRGTINTQLIHVSDWLPTLVRSVAGGQTNGTKPLDGYDVWQTISQGAVSPRTEILHNIDPMFDYAEITHEDQALLDSLPGDQRFDPGFRAAIRVGDWKLLTGSSGCPFWRRPPESPDLIPIQSCPGSSSNAIQLYNIRYDPRETCNVARDHKELVLKLLQRLQFYQSGAVPANFPATDSRANPLLHGGLWMPYLD
ncbi:arylsulfatase B-like [Patiria miniata]|uniref:Sulfatase N-terminal domain-containing protein n=1 Tax=Patiria miniata TaxID=46514 RepID=A0A914ASI6_PATMI|nr:arylsulfatase B-like [Patiria miniata]